MNILWIDDEPIPIQIYIEHLTDNGYNVDAASTLEIALRKLELVNYDLIIVDLMMQDKKKFFEPNLTRGGFETGKVLARLIRQKWPKSKIVGCSISRDTKSKEWFINNCDGYLDKAELKPNDNFVRKIKNLIDGNKDYKPFIVHGHDDELLMELKDYITNVLKLSDPVILREQPSLGRTIIEKFEDCSDEIDLVFVLLTPDDKAFNQEKETRRARQNVIF